MKKSERRKAYKEALLWFKAGYSDGICIALSEITKIPEHDIPQVFVEFISKKPFGIITHYWFPFTEAGNEKRISILKECIKETLM